MQNSIRIITICCIVSLLSGCGFFSVYKHDEQQGNLITSDMINTLSQGMTREQVLYVMGAPVLDNPFNANEWDYVYRLNAANGKVYIKRVFITFQNDRVVNIQKNGDLNNTPAFRSGDGPATEITVQQVGSSD